jgi:hypothetical protein
MDGVEQEYFGRDCGGFGGQQVCGILIARELFLRAALYQSW